MSSSLFVGRTWWWETQAKLPAVSTERKFAAIAARVLVERSGSANANQLSRTVGVDAGHLRNLLEMTEPFEDIDLAGGRWVGIDIEALERAIEVLRHQHRRWLPLLGQLVALEVQKFSEGSVSTNPLPFRSDEATARLKYFENIGLIVEGNTILRHQATSTAKSSTTRQQRTGPDDLEQDPEPDANAADVFAQTWYARADAEFPGRVPTPADLRRCPGFDAVVTAAARLVAEQRHHGHMTLVEGARELAQELSTDVTRAGDQAKQVCIRLNGWIQGFQAKAAAA